MNVWWIHSAALPPTEAGGTRHYSFARELIEQGHDVAVVTASFHYVRREELRLEPGEDYRLEIVERVPFLWIRTPPYQHRKIRRVWSWFVFAARLWKGTGLEALAQPDLIIGSSPYPFAALAAESIARRYGVPFILEIRDLWPETVIRLGEVSRWHPFILALELIERHLYRTAEHIITVLPRGKDYMVTKGAHRERVSWIPNAVDLRMVPEPRPASEEGALTIMYAGSHGASNCLDLLLDAAVILQDDGWNDRVRFHLVGHGPAKPQLVARVERDGLENVRFSDAVPKKQVYDVLSTADAFVLLLADSPLYQWGASPQKLFDYMAAGRPILLGSSSSWNPVGEAGCGVTFSPEDPPAVARAAKKLASLSPKERSSMGERARRYVQEHHDLSVLARRLEALLQHLGQAHLPE